MTATTNKGRILIVDVQGSGSYAAELSAAGYEVECVSSGAEAIGRIVTEERNYRAMVVTPRVADMTASRLVKLCATTDRQTIQARVPLIMADKHAYGITHSWFAIAPDTVGSVQEALELIPR